MLWKGTIKNKELPLATEYMIKGVLIFSGGVLR